MGFFAPAAGHRGHPFLDDVEELEGDRVGLHERSVRTIDGVECPSVPRQAGGKILMSESGEHVGEGVHREAEFGVEQLESVVQQRFVSGHRRPQ